MRTKVSGGRGNLRKKVNQVTKTSFRSNQQSDSEEVFSKGVTSNKSTRLSMESRERLENSRMLKKKDKKEEIIDISSDSEADISTVEVESTSFQKSMGKFDRDDEERDFRGVNLQKEKE